MMEVIEKLLDYKNKDWPLSMAPIHHAANLPSHLGAYKKGPALSVQGQQSYSSSSSSLLAPTVVTLPPAPSAPGVAPASPPRPPAAAGVAPVTPPPSPAEARVATATPPLGPSEVQAPEPLADVRAAPEDEDHEDRNQPPTKRRRFVTESVRLDVASGHERLKIPVKRRLRCHL